MMNKNIGRFLLLSRCIGYICNDELFTYNNNETSLTFIIITSYDFNIICFNY